MSGEGALASVRVPRALSCCALGAGGRAAGGAGRALRVWRWRAGAGWEEAARAPDAHRHAVTRLAWGELLVSAGIDGAIRVWSEDLELYSSAAAPGAAAVRALQLGPGRLAAGHDDGAVSLWLAPRLRLLLVLRAHAEAVAALALHRRLLVTGCSEGVLKVFDLQKIIALGGGRGIEVHEEPLQCEDDVHDLGVLCAAVKKRRIATGGQDGYIHIWRAGLRRLFRLISLNHGSAVTALAWSRDTLASAALDGSAKLWRNGACTRHISAHRQFLTDIALDEKLRFMVTTSNDRMLHMWALEDMSVDDEIEPSCDRAQHYGLGDLEGIEATPAVASAPGEPAARVAWEGAVGGAAHALDAYGDLIAVAIGEGGVRVLRRGADGALRPLATAGGGSRAGAARAVCLSRALLAAGGGGRAWLADAAGAVLAALPAAAVCEARVTSRGGDALLLLAAEPPAVWSLPSLELLHSYEAGLGLAGARCCAWSGDARLAALGGAGGGGEAGALALVAPPPAPAVLAVEPGAHDLGIQSIDFSESTEPGLLQEDRYLVLTVGSDCYLRLWFVDYPKEATAASLTEAWSIWAHGGSTSGVRAWRGVCATAGADGWARVWRVGAAPALLRSVPGPAAGAPLSAVLWLPPAAAHPAPALAAAALSGQLAVWDLPLSSLREPDEEDALAPAEWTAVGVRRWLKDYVTRVPGEELPPEEEARILSLAEYMTGSDLLEQSAETIASRLGVDVLQSKRYSTRSTDLESMLDVTLSTTLEDSGATGDDGAHDGPLLDDEEAGAGEGDGGGEVEAPRGAGEVARRLREELFWLKREPSEEAERTAPHHLRCPLSHRVLRSPTRAADGFTYSRRAVGARAAAGRSPATREPLPHARLAPNRRTRRELREFLLEVDGDADVVYSGTDDEGDW